VKQSSTVPGPSNNVSSNNEANNNDDNNSADDEYGTMVVLCHNPGAHQHTISVNSNSVPAHLAQGDTLGACT
jgi:hypothetical protein